MHKIPLLFKILERYIFLNSKSIIHIIIKNTILNFYCNFTQCKTKTKVRFNYYYGHMAAQAWLKHSPREVRDWMIVLHGVEDHAHDLPPNSTHFRGGDVNNH